MAEGKGYEAVLSGELTWTWDAPKALGDALEACLGAVFVDDGCRMEGVERVLDELFEEILEGLGEVEMRVSAVLRRKLREVGVAIEG